MINTILFILMIVFGFAAIMGIFWTIDGEGSKPNKTKKRGIITICFGLIAVSSLFIGVSINNSSITYTSEFYQIYNAECPFGRYFFEGEGKAVMFLFMGSASISFGETEKYVIKYMIDDSLHTKVFIAEESPVIVDGQFVVEAIFKIKNHYILDELCCTEKDIYEYRIHLPFLEQPIS